MKELPHPTNTTTRQFKAILKADKEYRRVSPKQWEGRAKTFIQVDNTNWICSRDEDDFSMYVDASVAYLFYMQPE